MKRMKKLLLAVLFLSMGFSASKADEGMWLLNKIAELNYADMQKLGCKLTAEEIYSINKSSLKDAIFQLMGEIQGQEMGFCTGEMISPKGLMLTNHHCGYESIAKLSSTEHDYLTNGFWSKSMEEELAVPGLAVSRVVRIEDVTSKVLDGVTSEMKESERNSSVDKAIREIEKAAKEEKYQVKVKQMYGGNEYYLFVYEVFGDVRLVGAPPSSIGKYGGDTDNWMWPRHTGDFSMFRVYMKADGSASKGYDASNVPYKPLHFLPISLNGYKEGDFTMILGFPGETSRFITSYGMKFKMNTFNPIVVRLLDTKLAIMREDMAACNDVRIALSDGYAQLANTWKNFQGEAEGLRKTDLIQKRQKEEAEFNIWAAKQSDDRFKTILNQMDTLYTEMAPVTKTLIYVSFGLLQASQQTMSFQQVGTLKSYLDKGKEKEKEALEEAARLKKEVVDDMFKEFFPATDKKIMTAMLNLYCKDIPVAERMKYMKETFFKKYKGKTEAQSIDAFVNAVYSKSIFTDKARMIKFLDKPTAKALSADPLYDFTIGIVTELQFGLQGKYMSHARKEKIHERILIDGMRKMHPNKHYSADANSTLRLTYGTVQSYDPRDGVHYKYITYIDGVIEKMDNTNDEFKVADRLVELYNKKDFGQYVDETGNLPVAFITDNDITGGNSGSPIVNAKGELLGAAFDGNWEWLTSNLVYNPKLQRTINCDVRYILWVVDKFAGAHRLIDEMTLVR
ncbi:MAG: S46 family peptidase [Bacteroidetes bacterium]|nr:S46 family peptidase [Bacteroidota bacterium]MBU1717794.1 S46 family peptidase [Bacteroidota bacterium]